MTLYVGIDPSSTCTGLVIVEPLGSVALATAIKRSEVGGLWQSGLALNLARLVDREGIGSHDLHVILEHQEWHGSRREKNPGSILVLQEACGIAVGVIATVLPDAKIRLVTPSEWKGQVDKESHHRVELMPKWQAAAKAPGVVLPKAKGPAADVLDAYGLAEFGRRRDRLEGIVREKSA